MRRWNGQVFASFVYVIAGSHGMVKVGVSGDPAARLATLQTGSAHHLHLAFSAIVHGDAYAAEAEAHALLSKYRQVGEWFAVPPDVAVAAVSAAVYRFSRSVEAAKHRPRWLRRYLVFTAIATPVWTFATPIPFVIMMMAFNVWLLRQAARSRGQWTARLGLQWVGVVSAAVATSLMLAMPIVAARAEGGSSGAAASSGWRCVPKQKIYYTDIDVSDTIKVNDFSVVVLDKKTIQITFAIANRSPASSDLKAQIVGMDKERNVVFAMSAGAPYGGVEGRTTGLGIGKADASLSDQQSLDTICIKVAN